MNNEEKSGINWKQIVYTAVITSLFSLIVGLSIYYLTQKKPELVYEEYPSSNFTGENNNLGIINCRISNIGSKEASNILCKFSFDPTFVIKDAKILTSNCLLSYKEIQNNCNYTKQYSFQLLNPKENCSFSFLVDNYKQNSKVMIALRGDGVNGKLLDLSEEKEITTGNIIVILVIGLLVIFILMLVFGVRYSIKKTKKLIEKLEKHTDNERKKAFDAINIGVEYCDMGLIDESIAMLKKSIYQFPEESSSHSNIARAYAYKQDFKKALMEIKIAEKLLKDDMDKLVFYYTSAQVYSLKNEKTESLKNLKKAYEIDPIRVYEKCQLDDDFDNIKDESSFKELKAPE
jgi:tetratricopeptide (TPR) repeat protein